MCCARNLVVAYECGAYGLVSLLRALTAGVILAYLQIFRTYIFGDFVAYCAKCQAREIERVGTHVGDVSGLIEGLRHTHGLCHRETELPCGLLLQCGSGEWRCRRLFQRLNRYIAHGECGAVAVLKETHGLVVVGKALVELGLHRHRCACWGELRRDAVVWLALEVAYFFFALGNQPHSHALHTAGRQRRLDFLPKHRRQLKTHDAVEHTARLLRINEVDVDVARVFYCLENCWLGDFVKHDALCVLGFEFKHLIQMPGNGFSLAVLITCEPHGLSRFCSFLQLCHQRFLLGRNFIYWLVAMFHVDAEILFVQVAYVAAARQDCVVFPKKFLNRFGFCRRLNYYQIVWHTIYNFSKRLVHAALGALCLWQKDASNPFLLTLTPTQSSMFFLFGCKIRKKLTNQ